MSYIGRQLNNLSDRVKLDSITASATATYNLLLNTVAYVPSSAESLTVSLNGVIQAPQDSYTVSGSTITFASTLSASDSIDFILAERSITLQTPSSGSVNTEQLANSSVTNTKVASSVITSQTAITSLADTDKFLVSDASDSGNLKYVEKQYLPSGGLVYLGGTTFSSTVADVDLDHFSSDYTIHKIYGILRCDTSGADFHLQWRNGGSDETSNVYYTSHNANLQGSASNSMETDFGGWGLTYMPFVGGTINSSGGGATQPPKFEMTVYNAMDTSYNKSISFRSHYYRTNNTWVNGSGSMYYNDGGSNTFEGVRLFPSGGNFDKGEIRVYGVVNS